ncbi:hypothetical protein PPYR_02523 [Photinus pyralis]|uniref:Dysbindin n=1 Tax=Photinus pyralis TaxID=7054 RepID=A0A1Y1L5R3_PHOPY|nr:dysbindin protein homolog [Photinus pyralis]XP_031355887.1 dysbindin protein homolog [Photinus pyralis]KAB0805535.1 hypothetical protein PPYR_02505 [Photinus pyralis]KAB0805553.1 hypothetical protein PPYR_02523 [Photinus pyralis]
MLTTLKGKLLNVSKIGLLSPTNEEGPTKSPVNTLNAGADILTHYQDQWADIHSLNEENASSAAKLAAEINLLHTKTSVDYTNVVEITHLLNATPTINKSMETCCEQIKHLHTSFQNVEKGILDLEDLIERIELERRKVEHKYQLALYKEKKMAHFEKVRTEMAAKHTQTVAEYELKQKKLLEERQQVFQDAFNDDLRTFKSLGNMPKIETNSQSSALLEEIQLDLDQQDLESFLSTK